MAHQLTDLHAQFKAHLEQSGKAYSTIIAYSKDIEQFVEFLQQQQKSLIDQVATTDIDEFKQRLKNLRYTSKSISRKLNSIKSFFRHLNEQNVITTNPAEVVSHPKYDLIPPRVLSKVEYRALRDAARGDARMYAIVELLLQTGMRISELASLELHDLDLDRNVISVKADNDSEFRRIPLNIAAKNAVQEYLRIRPRAKEKTLFLTKTCRPFLVRNIRTAIDRYFRLAGISDAKVNDLRHTFIVEQLKAGTPLVYVSQLVGHKRITTTEKYLKLIEDPTLNPQVKIEEL